MMNDLSEYNIEICKDKRIRAYNKKTHKVVSYPRIIMENVLNRPLLKTEDVHHLDGNPLNNDPSNLKVIDHKKHTSMHGGQNKKYYDKEITCPICGNVFIWTAQQQSWYDSKTRRTKASRKYPRQPPCCSKKCAGIYAAQIQYKK